MSMIYNLLASSPAPPTWWWPCIIALIAVLFIPWIVLLIYALTVKYRVRLYSEGNLIGTYKFKKNTPLSEIKLPERKGYVVEGLYRDEEFILPLEFDKMPNKNLKLYIKWIETK